MEEQVLPYIDIPPILLRELAKIHAKGNLKYAPKDWENHLTDKAWLEERANHAFEHFIKALHNENGEESRIENLAAVVWFCGIFMKALSLSQDHRTS